MSKYLERKPRRELLPLGRAVTSPDWLLSCWLQSSGSALLGLPQIGGEGQPGMEYNRADIPGFSDCGF